MAGAWLASVLFNRRAETARRLPAVCRAAGVKREDIVREDREWSGDKFVEESEKLVSK